MLHESIYEFEITKVFIYDVADEVADWAAK